MKSNEDKEYEELLRLIEEEADNWLEEHGMYEFEDTPHDPQHLFRFEYQHELVSNSRNTRFKKWSAE